MRRYETIYIVDSNLEPEKIEAIGNRVKEFVNSLGGKMVEERSWGKRRLAYEIKKRQYGTYVILNYEAPMDAIQEIERFLRLNQYVLRFLTVFLSNRILRNINLDAERVKREEEKALEAAQITIKGEEQ